MNNWDVIYLPGQFPTEAIALYTERLYPSKVLLLPIFSKGYDFIIRSELYQTAIDLIPYSVIGDLYYLQVSPSEGWPK